MDGVVCSPDEMNCNGTCSALSKDPSNCGACGTVCPQGTVCFAGTCSTSCGYGTVQCGQSCVDPAVDRDNCGGCGAACGKGLVCMGSKCSTTCAESQSLCLASNGEAYCANTDSDNKNCGGCAHVCGPGLVCSSSKCSSTCEKTQSFCLTGNGDPYCANTDSDNKNCGGCGHSCGPQELCAGGSCASVCAQGQATCVPSSGQPYCATTESDPNNCGSCGHACAQTEFCSSGACTCLPGLTRCNGACTDISNDPKNCGACGHGCGTYPSCTEGHCYGEFTGLSKIEQMVFDYKLYATDSGLGAVIAITNIISSWSVLASNQGGPTGIATDTNNIYWANSSSGEIVKMSKQGGNPVVLASGQAQPRSIAVDGSYVYWWNTGGNHEIRMVPVAGGTPTTITTGTNPAGALAYRASFDLSYVYAMALYEAFRCPTGGGATSGWGGYSATTNLVLGIADDGYVGNKSTGWIIRKARPGTGGNESILSSSTSPGQLAVVGTSLYWTDEVPNGKVYVTDALVGGVAIPFADVGGQPGAIAADKFDVCWATDKGIIYWADR